MVVISVLSLKGGVGKTTVTTNLATALTEEFKRKVVVLDSNVSSAHVGLHFGIYGDIPTTLPDVMKQQKSVFNSVYRQTETGVDIVPSSVAMNEDVNMKKIKDYILELAESEYDFLIVDCAPGFGVDIVNAIKAADEIIIVTTPNIPDIGDAVKLSEQLANVKRKKVRIVLNRVKGEKYELGKEEIASRLRFPIVSVIPEDKSVPESIAAGMPVVVSDRFSKAAIEFKRLAASILGEEYRVPGLLERFRYAFARPSKRRGEKKRLKKVSPEEFG